LKERVSSLSKVTGNVANGFVRIQQVSRILPEKGHEEIPADSLPIDLEELIESTLKVEKDIRREWLPTIHLARVKADTFMLPAMGGAEKAGVANSLERFGSAILSLLEALQDLRWNLMAFRAAVEDPGDCPVFKNPQDLLVYLQASAR
jgi:hypothetical protein